MKGISLTAQDMKADDEMLCQINSFIPVIQMKWHRISFYLSSPVQAKSKQVEVGEATANKRKRHRKENG